MFMCKQGHLHGTQQAADKCYICKRRKREMKGVRRLIKDEGLESILARLKTNTEEGDK